MRTKLSLSGNDLSPSNTKVGDTIEIKVGAAIDGHYKVIEVTNKNFIMIHLTWYWRLWYRIKDWMAKLYRTYQETRKSK